MSTLHSRLNSSGHSVDELKVRSSGELTLASHLLTSCRVSVAEILLQLSVARMLTVGGNNNDTLRNMLVTLYLSAFTVRCAHSCVCVCVHSDGIRAAVPADETEGSREYTRAAEEEGRRSSFSSSHLRPTTGRCNVVSAAPPVCCNVNVKCSGVMSHCSAGCQTM